MNHNPRQVRGGEHPHPQRPDYSSSVGQEGAGPRPYKQDNRIQVTEKAERLIIETEADKAHLYPMTGNNHFQFTAQANQEYLIMGAHIKELTLTKIEKGEYVDFGKLLPRDKVLSEEDSRLKLIVRDGKTFWVPVSEMVVINGFSRWEQAFRIYSNIYTHKYPNRSTELIQYNHIIHSIAGIYVWDNVYAYDKEFRMHLAKHPERSWSVILEQAWAMKLRDRLYTWGDAVGHVTSALPGDRSGSGKKAKVNEPCKRFNRGNCNFGPNCKYEHRCAYEPCGKFGHNILNCQKLQADRERKVSHGKNHGQGQGQNRRSEEGRQKQ